MKILKSLIYTIFIILFFSIVSINIIIIKFNYKLILSNKIINGILGMLITLISVYTFIQLIKRKILAFYFISIYSLLDITNQLISNKILSLKSLIAPIILILISILSIKLFEKDWNNDTP